MREPRKAADFLSDIIREAGTARRRSRYADALVAAVGQELAGHLQVLGCRGGKLYVEVDSAPLLAELAGFRREEIRRKCNEHLEPEQLAELVFRSAGTGHV